MGIFKFFQETPRKLHNFLRKRKYLFTSRRKVEYLPQLVLYFFKETGIIRGKKTAFFKL